MKRKAWIIGASTGIGAAVADELTAKGWDVVRSSRSQGEIRIDVSDDASVIDAANRYQEAHGNFDLVLVMAGFWQRMSAKQFDLEVFKEHNNTNNVGLARCVAAVLPRMIAQNSGTLIGVSSVAGFRGLPGSSGYGPSKAAQINLLEIKPDLTDLVSPEIQLTPQLVIKMKYPEFGNVKESLTMDNITDITFNMIANSVEYIYDGEQFYYANEAEPGEMLEFIESLNQEQFEKIENFFNNLPKMTKNINLKCGKCGFDHTIEVEGLENFFG